MRLIPFLILLVACTHYPDDCNRRALGELRVVERLIAETRENLARGYSYETVESGFRTGFVVCSGGYDARICTASTPRYTRRPVAIDPESERRKLESLVQRREALATAMASCRPT
jgi:hypothetical protein